MRDSAGCKSQLSSRWGRDEAIEVLEQIVNTAGAADRKGLMLGVF